MKDKLIYPKSNKDKSKEGGLAGASEEQIIILLI